MVVQRALAHKTCLQRLDWLPGLSRFHTCCPHLIAGSLLERRQLVGADVNCSVCFQQTPLGNHFHRSRLSGRGWKQELLKIPFVYSHYTSPGHIIEKKSGRLPFPPSYVPVMFAELSDRMTFMERIKNMLYTLYFDLFFTMYKDKKWNQFYSEVLGKLGFLIAQCGKESTCQCRRHRFDSWTRKIPCRRK